MKLEEARCRLHITNRSFRFDVEQATSGDKKFSGYLNIPEKTEETSFIIMSLLTLVDYTLENCCYNYLSV